MRRLLVAVLCAALFVTLRGQSQRLPPQASAGLADARVVRDGGPSARLIRAPRIMVPGDVDSNVPLAWDLVDGRWLLFALTSFGGVPARHSGPALDQMQQAGPVAIVPHPGHGVWIESIVPDERGVWYGYYHHERDAVACGRNDRFIPRVGAVRSTDHGATWQHLGFVLEAAPDTNACDSTSQGAPPLDIPAGPLDWLPISLAALRAARTAMRSDATSTKFTFRAA